MSGVVLQFPRQRACTVIEPGCLQRTLFIATGIQANNLFSLILLCGLAVGMIGRIAYKTLR